MACIAALSLLSCGAREARPSGLTIAAAANLTAAFGEIGRAFTRKTGVPVTYSYGATSLLAQQIENAAPFDLFAAADTQHVDALIRNGKLLPESRAIYARGQLALWSPNPDRTPVRGLQDLASPAVRYIALANPSAAPYGEAAVAALRAAGLWERLQPKIVYGSNIIQAKQFAASGNAEAAITAYSLLLQDPGAVVKVDENLHQPLDQALAIVAGSHRRHEAARFAAFVLASEGRTILSRHGYRFHEPEAPPRPQAH